MEIVYFTITAVALYFVSGWILNAIESYMGKRLKQRSIIYFFILLVLAIAAFSAIERFAPTLSS